MKPTALPGGSKPNDFLFLYEAKLLGGLQAIGHSLSRYGAIVSLAGADLSSADLVAATLSGATLSEADLVQANLSGATLSYANLSQATLGTADLSSATSDPGYSELCYSERC
jgi:hypothetical protein